MYELNRARLIGVGPRGARYTDVTLDLSGIGVATSNRTLFDGPTRRPSPVSLMMLENGGGKTVLLKLIFSVVLPGRKKVVGGKSSSLERFVLGNDAGHVALEWMHVVTGDLLVTAKVFQLRARAAGSNPLAEAWYSFRPSDSLSLDTLPTTENGRRRRMEGYREAVAETDRLQAATQLTWVGDEQGVWIRHLRDLGLEPDLFDIQRSMNVDEGDAANAFTFGSAKQFIDWLLRTVTDPADSIAVADTFDKWATNLAERDTMILERDFLEGAIAGLEPLSEAYAALTDASAQARGARRRALGLASSLAARTEREQLAADEMDTELDRARSVATAKAGERDRANNIANEVNQQIRQLELAGAKSALEHVKVTLDEADASQQAWLAVPAVHESMEADAVAQAHADLVAAAHEGAAPALQHRDRAAGRLLAKIAVAAAAADTRAKELEKDALASKSAATQADAALATALRGVDLAEERHAVAQKDIEAAETRLSAAAEGGLIPAGTTAAALPRLLQSAREQHEWLVNSVAASQGRLRELASAIAKAGQAASEQAELVRRADSDETESGRALTTALTAAQRVAALDAVLRAAGAEDATLSVEDLDEQAETLLASIQSDLDDAEGHLSALRNEHLDDQRVMDALGDGGLLPERGAVKAALDVLSAAGINAHSGWRYLNSTAAADERERLIGAHPELADGIVVVNADTLPAAQAALTEARLYPSAAVAVGAGAALLEIATQLDQRFVIEATPALYDETAAEERRSELTREMNTRSNRINIIDTEAAELRAAVSRVSVWREASPRGHLAGLRLTHTAAVSHAGEIRKEAHLRRAALTQLTELQHVDEEAHQKLSGRERDTSDRLRDLHALADAVADTARIALTLDDLVSEASRQRSAAGQARKEREDALAAETSQRLQAAEEQTRAAQLRSGTATIESSAGRLHEIADADTLPALWATYTSAQSSYLAAAPDDELKAAADRAASAARELRTQLQLRESAHVRAAMALLASPSGADQAGWELASAAARRQQTELSNQRDELLGRIGTLTTRIQENAPKELGRATWIVLPEEWRPDSVQDGQHKAARAAELRRSAQSILDVASARVTELERAVSDRRTAVVAFERAYLPMSAVLYEVDGSIEDTATPIEPFDGTGSEAAIASAQALLELRGTTAALDQAQQATRDAHVELIEFARQPRYEPMINQIRTALLNSSLDTIAAQAQNWAGQLDARRASLETDIADVSRHRNTIVERLATLVDQALRTLRTASKFSKLPDSLGDWAGEEFLRIRFSPPDLPAVNTRVGDVIDQFAAAAAGRPSTRATTKRDGFALLLEAVHAAIPNGFTVEVLKPDSVLRDERVPIEEMNSVFSGGQELTAAIVLYCTLAAVKANDRGQMRAKHAGVLFLDNPIGKASASYLLDLQKGVAQALGVQLVYTTGLSDDRALAAFPLWIRMRNDADLRAGLKHIRVADDVRQLLPEPFDDTQTGPAGTTHPATITSTRVHTRPQPTGPAL
jgi:hypothetical protein